MFASAEVGHALSQELYDAELPDLRANLLNAHLELRGRKFPVIVIVSGADGAGKGELVQRLNEWLDPRGVQTQAFWEMSDEERERPEYWRFWRALPAKGRIGIFFGSWYTSPIIDRVFGGSRRRDFEAALDRIVAFEKMLTDDGALIVKLWLHLSKRAQKRRLRKLERDGRLAPDDWKHFKRFDKFTKASARALEHTNAKHAPWHVLEASDRRYREFHAGKILLDAITARLKETSGGRPAASGPVVARRITKSPAVLARITFRQRLAEEDYAEQLDDLQSRLSTLAWVAHEKRRSMVLVFEGWDAAGKGSAIRRITQAMDPRLYRVVGIAAPTDEERAQHYLWRFWRHLPRAGFTTLFDRSWYGRVLVERVEGFASAPCWHRAYGEINDFEAQLVAGGIVVNKFWLHVSQAEQLRRFEERQRVAYKHYKITDEDWRNRKKWPAYQVAVEDMIASCSTEAAPWTIIAANDKRFARVQILKTIVKRLEQEL